MQYNIVSKMVLDNSLNVAKLDLVQFLAIVKPIKNLFLKHIYAEKPSNIDIVRVIDALCKLHFQKFILHNLSDFCKMNICYDHIVKFDNGFDNGISDGSDVTEYHLDLEDDDNGISDGSDVTEYHDVMCNIGENSEYQKYIFGIINFINEFMTVDENGIRDIAEIMDNHDIIYNRPLISAF